MSHSPDVEALRLRSTLLLPHLDERQRRLYLGVEARALGRGGTETVARAAGVSRRLVRVGRQEVEMPPDPGHRVRRPGGGRKRAAETDLTLVADLESLLRPGDDGDRSSPLRWTCRSSLSLAAALHEMGHRISPTGVQRLLRTLGYRMQTRMPARGGRPHADPDGQFRYVSLLVSEQLWEGRPVLSVEATKRGLIVDREDDQRENGIAGAPGCPLSLDPDPSGRPPANQGNGENAEGRDDAWLPQTEDEDTAACAVEAVRRWWHAEGPSLYPTAGHLLLCVNTGGRVGFPAESWRGGLSILAAELGLRVTVCHLPAGARRWSMLQRRLALQMCTRWQGRAPAGHRVTVDVIGPRTGGGDGRQREGAAEPAPVELRLRDRGSLSSVTEPHSYYGEWNYSVVGH